MIWQVSGYLSMDPRPFTLGQLLRMFEGRHDSETANLLSILAAIYSNVCQKIIKPSDLEFEGDKTTDEEMTEEQAISFFIAIGACSG